MTKYLALAAAAILAGTILANARTTCYLLYCQPGQTVIVNPDDSSSPDQVCTTEKALVDYDGSKDLCAMGDASYCKEVKGLETRGICGAAYKRYVVISIDPDPASDTMQISPVEDRSKIYWGRGEYFDLAE